MFVYDHEDKSVEWIIMYNDTMDMKWKDVIKAHGILKALHETYTNTVKSITFPHLVFHTI